MRRRWFLRRLSAAALLAGGGAPALGAPEKPLRAYVAASLLAAFRAVLARRAQASSDAAKVFVSYGSSAALARRIEQGAPADLFVSANRHWMDHLQVGGEVAVDTRRDIVANRLALAAAPGAAEQLASRNVIDSDIDLIGALGDNGRLAIARVASVPLGVYGRQALTKLRLWRSVSSRLAEAADARGALAYVASGATPLGVVYASDLVAARISAENAPRLIGLFPQSSHEPIVYPAALTKTAAASASAQDLLAYLHSAQAQSVFRDYGFTSPSA